MDSKGIPEHLGKSEAFEGPMAQSLSSDATRLLHGKGGKIDRLQLRVFFRHGRGRQREPLFSFDLPCKLLGQALYGFGHGPKTSLAREDLLDAVCKRLPLLSRDLKPPEIKDDPLTWPLGSTMSLHEPVVDVDLSGRMLFFSDFSYKHAMTSTIGEEGS